MTLFLLCALQCLLLSVGHSLLKRAMTSIGSFEWTWAFFFSVLTNWWLLLAGIILTSATFLWMYILRHYPLSQAYPLTSISYVLSVLIAIFFLGENVPILHWVGVALIVFGSILLTRP